MTVTCSGCTHTYAETALYCPNCGRPKSREPIGDALLGKVLGERFCVNELIGQGASGTIYRGEHVTLRRKVAIKVLHTELSRDDLAVERFRREATTVAEIDNEHIVEIHDFGRTPDGRLYLAMELLEGETLDFTLAREKQLSVERTADILIQVGEALMEAHAIGYVHRDLRPRNIYLANRRGKANFVKLLDFGLAKLVENDASAASTSLGMTFGDPRYMSPEQARGDRIDRRADIYQLGCVAYEMLTGAPPFSGHRVFDILTKQVTETPVPLPTKRPGVPLWMEAAIVKMLAKDPDNRFATTTRMVEALRRGLDTGEVMEDEIARRRESIPPPSVSRVMQKMGISQASDVPVHRPDTRNPPQANETTKGIAPVPEPKPSSVAPRSEPTGSDALVRKRTGTPRVGVPVVPPEKVEKVDDQRSVAGVIEKRAQPSRPVAEPGVSQVWFDEGDSIGDRPASKRTASRSEVSASTTDMSLYDELPRRSRLPWIAAAIGLMIVGGVAFAITRAGGDDDRPAPEAAKPVAHGLTVDAAPSQILEPPDAAAAAPAVVETRKDRDPKDTKDRSVGRPSGGTSTVVKPERPDRGGAPSLDDFVMGGPGKKPADPTPTGTTGTSTGTTVTGTTVTGTTTTGTRPPKDPPPRDPPRDDPSGTGGPKDPYDEDPSSDASEPAKKAEFFANIGAQQLAAGDTTNAAVSFKKALEIDGKNVVATIGLGEIALRQGLFGDAIAHLRKAARMAPGSSRVLTLLGEAFLSSGNTKEAIANFKKALALDPDNKRAREGLDEANARQTPTDE